MSVKLVDRTTSAKLMHPALVVIDSLRDAGYGVLDFRLGGGTALMFESPWRRLPPTGGPPTSG